MTTEATESVERLAYSIEEAAQIIGVSDRHLAKAVHRGELETFRIGTSRRVSRYALLQFIENREEAERAGERSQHDD